MIQLEGPRSVVFASQAHIVEDTRDCAWAERHVRYHPSHKWILGKYVEADQANNNKQYWSLEDLREAKDTVKNTPLNILHRPRQIVGSYVDAELVYPTGGQEAAGFPSQTNPYVEALGVFWHYYFPNEFRAIESAYATGSLFFSMECEADSITEIASDGSEGETFAYKGPRHPSYSQAINKGEVARRFNNTRFLGGALIIPPASPGWGGAAVKEVSQLIEEHQLQEQFEIAREDITDEAPELSPKEWETLMASVVRQVTEV